MTTQAIQSRVTVWRAAQVLGVTRQQLSDDLEVALHNVLRLAVGRTPKETGTLRRSGTVAIGFLPSAGEVYAGAISGEMAHAYDGRRGSELAGYITFATPYARRQHEELGYAHSDGEAKYLENAFTEGAPAIAPFLELRLRKRLQGER